MQFFLHKYLHLKNSVNVHCSIRWLQFTIKYIINHKYYLVLKQDLLFILISPFIGCSHFKKVLQQPSWSFVWYIFVCIYVNVYIWASAAGNIKVWPSTVAGVGVGACWSDSRGSRRAQRAQTPAGWREGWGGDTYIKNEYNNNKMTR